MEMENKVVLRRCFQTKCTYHIENPEVHGLFAMGCPICSKCSATSNVVNQECATCLACEGEEGVSRDLAKQKKQVCEVMIEAK